MKVELMEHWTNKERRPTPEEARLLNAAKQKRFRIRRNSQAAGFKWLCRQIVHMCREARKFGGNISPEHLVRVVIGARNRFNGTNID